MARRLLDNYTNKSLEYWLECTSEALAAIHDLLNGRDSLSTSEKCEFVHICGVLYLATFRPPINISDYSTNDVFPFPEPTVDAPTTLEWYIGVRKRLALILQCASEYYEGFCKGYNLGFTQINPGGRTFTEVQLLTFIRSESAQLSVDLISQSWFPK